MLPKNLTGLAVLAAALAGCGSDNEPQEPYSVCNEPTYMTVYECRSQFSDAIQCQVLIPDSLTVTTLYDGEVWMTWPKMAMETERPYVIVVPDSLEDMCRDRMISLTMRFYLDEKMWRNGYGFGKVETTADTSYFTMEQRLFMGVKIMK